MEVAVDDGELILRKLESLLDQVDVFVFHRCRMVRCRGYLSALLGLFLCDPSEPDAGSVQRCNHFSVPPWFSVPNLLNRSKWPANGSDRNFVYFCTPVIQAGPTLMDSMKLLAPLVFVIASLFAGAILKYGLKRTVLPYTVGLFAFGLFIGLLSRAGLYPDGSIFKAAVDFAGHIDPDLILYHG